MSLFTCFVRLGSPFMQLNAQVRLAPHHEELRGTRGKSDQAHF